MSFICYIMLTLFYFFMQHLARDTTEMAELQEEVTGAQAAAIMVRACATQVERIVREKTVVLVTAHGEAIEVTQTVSILGDELVVVCRVGDIAKEKTLRLAVT
jgi:hypothetical protein